MWGPHKCGENVGCGVVWGFLKMWDVGCGVGFSKTLTSSLFTLSFDRIVSFSSNLVGLHQSLIIALFLKNVFVYLSEKISKIFREVFSIFYAKIGINNFVV